mgnify:CR=1 FL=1
MRDRRRITDALRTTMTFAVAFALLWGGIPAPALAEMLAAAAEPEQTTIAYEVDGDEFAESPTGDAADDETDPADATDPADDQADGSDVQTVEELSADSAEGLTEDDSEEDVVSETISDDVSTDDIEPDAEPLAAEEDAIEADEDAIVADRADDGTDEVSTQSDKDSKNVQHAYGSKQDPIEPLSIHDENEEGIGAQATLPSSYSSVSKGYVTPVRDQAMFGTCWAFASIAALESSMLRTGVTLSKTKSSLNLSERHLAYFTYNTVKDPLGGTAGDETYAIGGDAYGYLDEGGSTTYAMLTLASWEGAAWESTAPYSALTSQYYSYGWASDFLNATKLSNSIARKDAVHMSGAYYIPMSERSDVKRAIQSYGAVASSYYDSNDYYNSATTAFYYPYSSSTNHGITIVGWNDDYSRDNFGSRKPSINGAWLAKGSWGTGWGNKGYYWISYADATISKQNAVAYKVEKTSKHQNIYQYDGSACAASSTVTSGGKIANVFQAKAGSKGEKLQAVSFVLWDTNVNYSIQVYKNPKSGKPDSGTKMLSKPVTGKTTYQGFYKVNLSKAISLPKGTKYSVVITLKKSNGSSISYAIDTTSYGQGCINATKSGQSYQKYGSSSGWGDHSAQGDNVRIKAYTTNATVSSKKANTLTVKATKKTVKYATVKKKAVTVTPLKVTKAKGTITYAKVSGSARLTVNKKTGKVTVRKGTKKGTYKAKVRVTAAGNSSYKKGTKTVTVTVVVKATTSKASEKEPNNSESTADVLKLGVNMYGKTDFYDDDYFAVSVSSAGTYKLTITSDKKSSNDGNVYAWVIGANGSRDFDLKVDATTTKSASRTVHLAKGKNYVWVWGNSSLSQHPYHVRIAKA